ncbi:MAG TPA: hypothetical protein VFZ91_09465 [Allosphingosinicella sp.]
MPRRPPIFSRFTTFLEARYTSHPASFLVYSAIVTAVLAGLIVAGLEGLSGAGSPASRSESSRDAVPIKRAENASDPPSRVGAPEASPQPPRATDLVRISATPPVIHACKVAEATACFRLTIRVASATNQDIQIGFQIDGPRMAGTHAVVGNSTACKGYAAEGLHYFSDYQDVGLQTATYDRPITGVLEFACDGDLVKGAMVSTQITLDIARPHGDPEGGRFILDDMALLGANKPAA